MEGGEIRQPPILWWNMGDLAERFGFPSGQASPGLQCGVVTASFSCMSQWLASLFTLCRCSVQITLVSGCKGWPTHTLSYVDMRESIHFQDSKPQHCRHSWELASSENLGVPPSSQRALQGGLLSSLTESLLPSFSLCSLTALFALHCYH